MKAKIASKVTSANMEGSGMVVSTAPRALNGRREIERETLENGTKEPRVARELNRRSHTGARPSLSGSEREFLIVT